MKSGEDGSLPAACSRVYENVATGGESFERVDLEILEPAGPSASGLNGLR